MADIHLQYPHSLSLEEARACVEKVANDLGREFSITSRWQGNVLHFDRLGVNGTFEVDSHQVVLTVTLGFLLKGLKSKIQSEASRMLEEKFGR